MFNLKRKNSEESGNSNQRNMTQRLHHNFIDNGAQRPLFGSRDCNICYINLDLGNIVQSKPCGHTSCILCLMTYFKKSHKFDCYSCRQNIEELFTTNNSIEKPEDFLKRNEKKEEETQDETQDDTQNETQSGIIRSFFSPDSGGSASNQALLGPAEIDDLYSQPTFFSPIRRTRTYNDYQIINRLYGTPNILLHSLLIENIHSSGTTQEHRQEQFIALYDIHSEPFLNKNIGNAYLTAFLENSYEQESSTADIVYIEDISGSMTHRLNDVKKGLISTIEKLENKNQRFTIVLFDDHAYQLFPLQKITTSNKDSLINKVRSITIGGGTNYNSAFSLLLLILEDAENSGINRKKIVKFGSDGENIGNTDYSLIDNIYHKFPNLVMYIISIGEGVNATRHLIPILRERSNELAKYMHVPNIEQFERILLEIIGDNPDTFANNLEIRFKNVKPVSLNAVEQLDGTYLVKFPYLNIGGDINIAFIKNDLVNIYSEITYNFTKNDGSHVTGKFENDNDKILPDSLTTFFSRKRIIDIEINNIISVETTFSNSNQDKKNLLTSLKTYITPDMMGYYYSDFLFEINKLIMSFDNTDNNSQNLRAEIIGTLRTDTTPMRSIARQASSMIHTQLSQMHLD